MATKQKTTEPTPDELQEKVIEAATQCFRRWGVRKTTMSDIANEMSVHRPQIYRHFRDKDELIAAVTIREARKLSRHRLDKFPIRGPVGTLLVDVLAAGLDRLADDEFLSEVMRGDAANLTVSMVAENDEFLEAEREWWKPVLAHGRKRGEIREDLEDDEIITWFLLMQVQTFERIELFGTPGARRSHIERFIVPAILSTKAR